jgi:hypothetical protein
MKISQYWKLFLPVEAFDAASAVHSYRLKKILMTIIMFVVISVTKATWMII